MVWLITERITENNAQKHGKALELQQRKNVTPIEEITRKEYIYEIQYYNFKIAAKRAKFLHRSQNVFKTKVIFFFYFVHDVPINNCCYIFLYIVQYMFIMV